MATNMPRTSYADLHAAFLDVYSLARTTTEQQSLEAFRPVLYKLDLLPITIREPITRPGTFRLDGADWIIYPLDAQSDVTFPGKVYDTVTARIAAMGAAHLPIVQLQWWDEQKPAPLPTFRREKDRATRSALEGALPTGSTSEPSMSSWDRLLPPLAAAAGAALLGAALLTDPALVACLRLSPTGSRTQRALWVLVEYWLD